MKPKHINAKVRSPETRVFHRALAFFKRHPQIKKFIRPVSPGEFESIQGDIPPSLSPRWVLVCWITSDTCARIPMNEIPDAYDGYVLNDNWKATRFPTAAP